MQSLLSLFLLLISESNFKVITLNGLFAALNYQGHHMETNINPSAISTVLILMAAASLFTMLSLNQMNYIVHGDLYNYGLQFSYRWAMPYWVSSGIIFGLSWVNIFLSIIVTLYIFKKSRKSTLISNILQTKKIEEAVQLREEKEQKKLSEYVKPQKEKPEVLKEEITEASREEFLGDEIKQPEETIKAQEAQTNQQETEEMCNSSRRC